MNSRRDFLRRSAQIGGAVSLSALSVNAMAEDVADALICMQKKETGVAVTEEELWARIAQAYTVTPNIINLNNGGVSPQPKVVQEAVTRFYQFSNELPSHYMWHVLDKGRETIRRKLSDLGGVSAEEIAINRNTTEALATISYGIQLSKGDEIVMTTMDYPNMIGAWKQKEMREGIRINWITPDVPSENADSIVEQFVKATTAKTRVWHITHMINYTGQILPVKKLCEEAKRRGIISIVDAAHTFAQLDYKISDFSPDYLGTSLHKWLCAPFGTGMLYVRRDRVKDLWPLFPSEKPSADDIRKFETLGTRSLAPEHAISQAIDFHLAIGPKIKEERLRYLKNYWCEKLAQHPRIKLHVSLKPEFSCALGTFSIQGIESEVVNTKLLVDHQIHAVSIKLPNLSCMRITPHVYTLTRDLDHFIEAVFKIANG